MPIENNTMMLREITRWLVGFMVGALSSVPCLATPATDLEKADWKSAIDSFYEAERHSPRVYDISDASRCRGRWALHAEMVDDGAFPKVAESVFTEPLRLPGALREVEFFYIEQRDIVAYRSAYDMAERNLALALGGDRLAALSYFTKLGQCYSIPETIKDDTAADMLASEIKTAAETAMANADFDEPVNLRRLAFAENFVKSLEAGESVAGYFSAEFDFTFTARHECGAMIAQRVKQLPAGDSDLGFMFWVTVPVKYAECGSLPEPHFMEAFNLRQTASEWSQMAVLLDNHNFEVFVISPEGSSESLIIHIEPHANSFVINKMEYQNFAS